MRKFKEVKFKFINLRKVKFNYTGVNVDILYKLFIFYLKILKYFKILKGL